MAQTVKLKRSNTAGTIPTTSNLALGEVAINTKDGKFFLRKHVDGSTGDAIHAYAPQGINSFGTQELVVKVITKTAAHPNHGNGSSNGYTIQGLEGPFLSLIPGNTYKFDQSDNSNSGHPLRFYLDAAKATQYTTGVTTSGSAGNSGAYVQIAVTTSTPQVLYYQCSNHGLMGSGIYVASDAIAANAVGTSQIAQNSITSSEIPDNSIGATQISAAVLAAKQDNLGNNSITAAMISQNTVGISELNVSDGSNGQVLTTNGSGTLSFANPSSGTVTETFKTLSVSGQDDVVADGATDTLTLVGGSGMTITTNASSDTITFVSSASGIADDAVTTSKIADLNVTSAKLAANSVTAAKIATDAVGASEIAANAVGISELNVSDGSNGQVLTTNGSGTLSFATASGSVSEAFKTLSVSGQDDVVADSATDTLTFAAGSNMTITTNASNDTITFASSGSGGSSSSFAKNTFTGDGSDTTFTLTTSMSNENGLIVFIDGVYQADNVYSVSGTTLTFATAPLNGRIIEVFQLEGGIVGTAPILATMTGDGSDTTLALGTTPSSENQCFVTIDGVMQHKSTYSVSGSTLTFSTAPPNGTAVEAITLTNTSVATFQDSDGDTKIQMEESSDEDKIRFDTAGTERMIITDTGRVGIGNSSPSRPVHIEMAGDATLLDRTGSAGGVLLFANGGTVKGNVGVQSGGFGIGGGFRDPDLFMTTGGAVGIGTTSPGENLTISSAGDTISKITTTSSSGQGQQQVRNSDDNGLSTLSYSGSASGTLFGLNRAAKSFISSNLETVIGTTSNHFLAFGTNSTEKMRIASGGDITLSDNLGVGTGTTAPNSRLQIKKDGTGNYANQTFSNANSTAGITFGIAGSGTGNYLANNAFLLNTGASAFIFGTSDTERMRIDSSGRLGIGTTSPNSGYKVSIDANANHGLHIGNIGNGYSGLVTIPDSSNNYFPLYIFNSSGNANGYILSNSSGTTFSQSGSDIAFKENVKDWNENVLDSFKNIKPSTFTYKSDENKKEIKGYIAQNEVDKFPEAYQINPKDGKHWFNPSGMTVYLMKAIQEQQVIIDDLKSRIETLEG